MDAEEGTAESLLTRRLLNERFNEIRKQMAPMQSSKRRRRTKIHRCQQD